MTQTRTSKAKARRLQNHVRDILRAILGLGEGDVDSAVMGDSGEDIKLSPAARERLPVSIECKARKSFAIYSLYQQAVDNAPEGTEPILVIRADRKKALAVVDLEYLTTLFEDSLYVADNNLWVRQR